MLVHVSPGLRRILALTAGVILPGGIILPPLAAQPLPPTTAASHAARRPDRKAGRATPFHDTGKLPAPQTSAFGSASGKVDASLAAAIQKALYRVEDSRAGTLTAANPAQHYTASFGTEGVQVRPFLPISSGKASESLAASPAARAASVSRLPLTPRVGAETPAPVTLRLQSVGYGEAQQAVDTVTPQKAGERVEYRHAHVTEWYVNTPQGLEQGFTLAKRLQASRTGNSRSHAGKNAPLSLWLRVDGKQTPRLSHDGSGALLGSGLRYGGLVVTDSAGKRLASSLAVQGHSLVVRVDDTTARYPLVVDPPITSVPLLIAAGPELTASDAAANDYFGVSVAVSGDTAVVGALDKNSNRGAAYVFTRTGTAWTQQQELTASDAAANDYFGYSVGVSGDTAVVGAFNKNSGAGAAYVFTRTGSVWTQQQELTASDAASFDYFGVSVEVSGDTAVVGAYGKTSNTGAAYVFTRSGTTWTQQQEITASDAANGDQLGCSVGVSGDTLVVGAYGKNSNAGAVYAYGLSPIGTPDTYVIPATLPYTVAADNGILGNDTDVDGLALTAVLFRAPANGTLTLNPDGGFTYTPNGGFTGTDTFLYLTRNSDGGISDPVLVTLIQRAQDVSASVTVTRGGYGRAAGAGNFAQKITLTNTGNTALPTPLSFVLDGLPAGVSVTNADGTTRVIGTPGSPYVNVAGPLAAGASVSLIVRFADPSLTAISYTARVLAGPGAH